VAQDALLACIVHVVLGRRCDLTFRVVAHRAILPTIQLVRDLGRQVDQEGGRLGKAGWRVSDVTLARQVVLRRFMAVAADEFGHLLSGVAALAGRGGVGSPQRDGVLFGWQAGIAERVTLHTFLHYLATHLLENHYDDRCNASARSVQELLGHREVETAMVYTHVPNRGGLAVGSPLD
jgi:integrase